VGTLLETVDAAGAAFAGAAATGNAGALSALVPSPLSRAEVLASSTEAATGGWLGVGSGIAVCAASSWAARVRLGSGWESVAGLGVSALPADGAGAGAAEGVVSSARSASITSP
jgi:hypothetical protein